MLYSCSQLLLNIIINIINIFIPSVAFLLTAACFFLPSLTASCRHLIEACQTQQQDLRDLSALHSSTVMDKFLQEYDDSSSECSNSLSIKTQWWDISMDTIVNPLCFLIFILYTCSLTSIYCFGLFFQYFLCL